MSDSEIIGRKIDFPAGNQTVQVGFVRIAEDLLITMVFHHDQKDMIEMRNTGRDAVFLGESARRERTGDETDCC